MTNTTNTNPYAFIAERPMAWAVSRGEYEVARSINRRTIRDWKRRRLAELGAPWRVVDSACNRPMRHLRQLPAWKNG